MNRYPWDYYTIANSFKTGWIYVNGALANWNHAVGSPYLDYQSAVTPPRSAPWRDAVLGAFMGMSGPFVIDASGQLTTLPGSTGGTRYADFQLWIGNFIDITVPANFSKFITISGGKGYPTNPAVATSAFGQQTILFKGKASDASFWINRGTGGTFTKTGTITDFTPTPSYG